MGFKVLIGFQGSEFENSYGGWSGHSPEYNRIGVVKLGAENLRDARECFEKAGFDVSSNSGQLIIKKDRNTGLSFLIEQGSAQNYFSALQKVINV